ncbi:hypothetical protein AVEN_45907-1 [Araneus ventricosus]|uniref:Uncharacterized protein n=1 Tax=Araneus ventricosus TaxID=182803 RepID=A0A4Y2E7X4_ARAVE|nr:hypothetical protein AVEN_45907-1 [Araneus ventricosus]
MGTPSLQGNSCPTFCNLSLPFSAIAAVLKVFKSVTALDLEAQPQQHNLIGGLIAQLNEIENCYLGHHDTQIVFCVISFCGGYRRWHVCALTETCCKRFGKNWLAEQMLATKQKDQILYICDACIQSLNILPHEVNIFQINSSYFLFHSDSLNSGQSF